MANYLTIKNIRNEIQIFSARIWLIASIIVLVIAFLAIRLIQLQIYQHQAYQTLSDQNQLTLIPIDPPRGLIYDRNGVLLAKNVTAHSLEIIPGKTSELKNTFEELKKIIAINHDEEQEFFKQVKLRRRFEPIVVKTKLSEQEIAKFYLDQYRFPGMQINARLIRHYPFDQSFAHVLGYVGRINLNELNNVETGNYSATNYIGKVGIEKYYENELHGKVGFQKVESNVSGKIIRTLDHTKPQSGKNLYLTIDSSLQIVAENALGENRGAIVAIDPNNGELLALVSKPSYEPNLFVTGISSNKLKSLQDSPNQPLFNRAIRGQYPPASTIKPFLALRGLDEKLITLQEKIFDPGYYKLENSDHLYRDWNPNGHGWINVSRALIESCDTYFYVLANRLGIKHIQYIMNKFGFGEPTGIDMGEELPGLLPTPAWKRAMQGFSWYDGDTLNTGIGQGLMLSTPLQLAAATASIAMRGQRYLPHLVMKKEIISGTQEMMTPVPLSPVQLRDQNTWREVIWAMQGVISSPKGTGFRFGRNAPYSVAGKTGTAQVFTIKQDEKYVSAEIPKHLRDHSLFISFAPVHDPRIAIAVIVENGFNAAGIAREIFDYYLIQQNHEQHTYDHSRSTSVKTN